MFVEHPDLKATDLTAELYRLAHRYRVAPPG
jgi:hypothetical protein